MQSDRGSKPVCVIFVPTDYKEVAGSTLFRAPHGSEKMRNFDIRYFESLGFRTMSSPLHYQADNNNDVKLIIEELATLPIDQEIQICFTAHGSPEKIGVSDERTRVTIDELIQILKNNGIDQLKHHDIHFQFRSCNSAYAPIEQLNDKFYLKKNRGGISENDQATIKNQIFEKSLIGKFYQTVKNDLQFESVAVSGFRGYYCPDQKGPRVSATFPPKKALPAEDRIITITRDGAVLGNIRKLLEIPNIQTLDNEHFPVAAPSASPRRPTKS